MTNAIIHKFEVDQLTDNIKSATFLRDDGTFQTLNDDNVTISASFTENGTYIPPSGVVGFDSIEINVPPSGKLETIEVELDKEAQTLQPSVGFDGIGEVRVPKTTLKSLSAPLTPNVKTYVAADDGYYGYSNVSVQGYNNILTDVTLEDLEDAGVHLGTSWVITPEKIYGPDTEIKGFSSFSIPQAILNHATVELSTSEQTITPPAGAYGLAEVTVPSVYTVFTDDWTITQNGDNQVPPSPYLGAGKVNVHVQPVLRDYTFTSNGGPYTAGAGYDGWGTININVPEPVDPHVVEANKNVTITSNGTGIEITPDVGYNVMSKVTLDVAVPLPTLQSRKTVTANVNNDTVTVTPDTGYDAIEEVQVNVQVPATGNVQTSKSVTYTQNGAYTVRADAGYDSVEQVNVTVNVSSAPNYSIYSPFVGGDSMSYCEAFFFTDKNFNTNDTFNFSSNDVGTTFYGVANLPEYSTIYHYGFADDYEGDNYIPEVVHYFPVGTTVAQFEAYLNNANIGTELNGYPWNDTHDGCVGFRTDLNPDEEHGALLLPVEIVTVRSPNQNPTEWIWMQQWDDDILWTRTAKTPYSLLWDYSNS
jgi:hypothetical protein